MRAVLFDLDETLVPDYGAFLAAVDAVAAALGAPAGMGRALHDRARPRWGQAPAATNHMWDMSSWEALWAPFPAETDAWADAYRLGAWREALADHDVDDPELAGKTVAVAVQVAVREHRLAGKQRRTVAEPISGDRQPARHQRLSHWKHCSRS